MTRYQLGADFERRTVVDLERAGYYAVRVAGSHSPTDVLAARQGPRVLFVQCRRSGRLDPGEWNELLELGTTYAAVPVLAQAGPKGRGVIYWELTGPKAGGGPQPRRPFTP